MSDLIDRQAAIGVADSADYTGLSVEDVKKVTDEVVKGLKRLPSAQPEYYDYSDIDDVWEFYAEEQDINLTDGAKQLKDAMWVGYQKGKQDAQPEVKVLRVPYAEKPIDMFDALSEEEKRQNKWYAEGFSDALKELSAQPEQQWIPVTERLPERYGWYLCTLKDGRVNCYYWNKKDEWVDNGKKHFFDLYNIRSRYTGEEINSEQEGSVYWTDWVIAWMPLPESWKGEKHETD